MDSLKMLLDKRRATLFQLKETAVKRLKNLKYKGQPEYHVRIDTRKSTFYINKDDGSALKLKNKKSKLVIGEQVANYEYLNKTIELIDIELKQIDKFLNNRSKTTPEDYYESLKSGRQKLIVPICQTDDQFVDEWINEPFERSGVPFGDNEFYTDKGERVRSKSEIIIANTLSKYGIPYKYECPIYIDELGVIHPDFTVLNIKRRKQLYWEHLGKMDDEQYALDNTYRINVYQKNGLYLGDNLIITWETSKMALDTKLLDQLIKHYLLE